MRQIEYINLTAGLELVNNGLINGDYRFIYLKSSHLESKAYKKYIQSLSADLLMNLALGNNVIIYDATSNGKSKLEKIGLPLIKYVLYKLWFNVEHVENPVLKEIYSKVYNSLGKEVRQFIRYYKNFLKTNKLNLSVVTLKLEKEDTAKIIKHYLHKYS